MDEAESPRPITAILLQRQDLDKPKASRSFKDSVAVVSSRCILRLQRAREPARGAAAVSRQTADMPGRRSGRAAAKKAAAALGTRASSPPFASSLGPPAPHLEHSPAPPPAG
ncbi:hypothetical protein TCAP_01086 [Tolypocladium capitatum]|uniref:Uncharacterized protein n=1 Tax=Tolypocladium capitatum TaxID=45235 RepID=A0A2K3QN88_9HYPO|nr:hypothetical protein TCAP_01086 [Tolypocladium capitatum]